MPIFYLSSLFPFCRWKRITSGTTQTAEKTGGLVSLATLNGWQDRPAVAGVLSVKKLALGQSTASLHLPESSGSSRPFPADRVSARTVDLKSLFLHVLPQNIAILYLP